MESNDEEGLLRDLDREYGLRNVRDEWFRRQTSFSAHQLRPIICRTDLCAISNGTLPWDVSRAHSVSLGITTLMQVEDVINVASADPRALTSNPRVFQATLTDGTHDVVAVELGTPPSPQFIQAASIPGTKLKIHASARLRRGRILLRSSDYTVLGAPPSNVWGPLYSREIANARQAAGLPDHAANAQASLGRVVESDNPGNASLVWTGDSSDPNALPLNIGGIADPALLAAAEEAENGVIVSQSQSQSQPVQSSPIIQVQSDNRNDTNVALRSAAQEPVEAPAHIQSEPELAQIQARQTNSEEATNNLTTSAIMPQLPVVNQQQSVNTAIHDEDMRRLNRSSEMEIPEVPESDEENWLALLSTQEEGPQAPFGRLCDANATMVRAYAVESRGGLANGTVLDDGFAIRAVTFGRKLMEHLSERAQSTVNNRTEEEGGQLRAAIRGACGFMSIRQNEGPLQGETEVYDVSAGPPGSEIEGRMDDFLNQFADNVEGRLVKSLMDGEL